MTIVALLPVLIVLVTHVPTANEERTQEKSRASLLWKAATPPGGDYVLALAVSGDGLIYAGTWIGTQVSVFTQSGAVHETLTVGRGVKALAVGSKGLVYAGTDAGTVVVFGPGGVRTGNFALEPSATAVGQIQSLVVGTDGVVYAATTNGLYAVNPDGAPRWRARMRHIDALTINSNGVLYAGAGDTISAFAADGTVQSEFKVGSRPGIVDAVSLVSLQCGPGKMLYAGTRYRVVYALDAADGTNKWTFKPRGTPFAIAEGPNGTIYVGSYDGNIYALDSQTGSVRWTFAVGRGKWGENPVHALAVAQDGVVYAGIGNSVAAISVPGSRR